jgi:hypothetical protein
MPLSKFISCIVRGIQTLFAALIIALVGSMITDSGYNMIQPIGGYPDNNYPSGGNPAEVNYAMFLGVWTLLSMSLLIPLALKPQSKESYLITTTVLDGLTALFYVCGGIALAAAMGIHSCNNFDYVYQNRITNNALGRGKRCREAQAATAFIWLNFLLFAVTTVISVRTVYWNSNPRDDDAETSPNTSGVSADRPAVATEAPSQPQNSGMSRFWGRRAAPSPSGPEVAERGNEAGVMGTTRFWGRRPVPARGGNDDMDEEADDSHNWRASRSLVNEVIPEVDDSHSHRS